jgi:hypothetical protein
MRSLGIGGAIAIALIAGTVSAGPASARSNHPSCKYSGYDDGCAKAYADGNFINPNFFSYAKQSGQGAYYSAPNTPSDHPMPWNVAGVDYPVGYSKGRKLQDPAVDKLPTGCTYSATGSAAHGAIVVCSKVNNLALKGWDFSLHNCTVLDIKSSVTGTITIKNSKFVNGSNCSVSNGFLAMIENSTIANFKFEHNYVDGLAHQYPTSLIGMIVPFIQGRMIVKYNAFLHSPARPMTSNNEGPLEAAYNYWEGWVYQPSDGHGEVVINYLGNDKHQSLIAYSYNTALEPNDVCANCGTSVWYPTGGGTNTRIDNVIVDHNTSIVNLHDGQVTVAAASAETSYNTYGAVSFQANYMDPTGAYQCFISISNPTYLTPPEFVGNINMKNGKTVTDYGYCP